MATESPKVSGTILRIDAAQQITEKLKKQVLVLITEGTYPQTIAVDFVNDKIDLLTPYAEGMEVSVAYNLRGREYNGRVFVNLDGWKIERSGGAEPAQVPAAKAASANKNPALRAQPAQIADEDSELPF